MIVRNKEIDIGTSDVPYIKTFQILEYHTYITAYEFSEQLGHTLIPSY